MVTSVVMILPRRTSRGFLKLFKVRGSQNQTVRGCLMSFSSSVYPPEAVSRAKASADGAAAVHLHVDEICGGDQRNCVTVE